MHVVRVLATSLVLAVAFVHSESVHSQASPQADAQAEMRAAMEAAKRVAVNGPAIFTRPVAVS